MIFKPTDFNQETTSKYYSHYFEKLQNFDFEGAMHLLDFIFKNEPNQYKKGSPTDFLHDEDGEKQQTLYSHFQEMINSFHFSEPLESRIERILENLEDSINEESLRSHKFRPFNGFHFKMSDYEFCTAVMDSVHFDLETREISGIFGLNHELIWDADSYPKGESSESYDFIYDLGDRKYNVSYLGEKLKGKDLHVHIKLLLFEKTIRKIFETLLSNERFAKIPKAFPFYILIDSSECYDYKKPFLLEVIPRLELDSLKENPYFTIFESSSQTSESVPQSEEFLFSLSFLEKPDQKEYQTLLRLVDSHPEWKALLLQGGKRSLQRTDTVIGKADWQRGYAREEITASDMASTDVSDLALGDLDLGAFWKKIQLFPSSYFSGFFWDLASLNSDPHLQTAIDFQKEIFFNSPQPLEDSYKEALPYIQEFSYTLSDSYLGIPENRKDELRGSFEEALNRLQELSHPGFKLRAMEIRTRLESGDWDSKINPILKNATKEYLQQMIELIRCLPEEFPWFGDPWDFIFENRLMELGHQAIVTAPALTEVLERYNKDHFNEDVTRNLAPIFYEIGCEDIHPLIHKLHERNEFYMEDFYHKWAKQAPADRWKRFEETIRTSPDSLGSAQTWENLLYPSDPGFSLYYENIEKESDRKRIFYLLLKALKNEPGETLRKFAFFYYEKLKNSAGKNRATFFQTVSEITELLNLLSETGELNEEQKFTLRCGIAAKPIETYLRDDQNTLELLDRTITTLSGNPLLFFLKVSWIEKTKGLQAAIQELKSVLRSLWKDDFVLKKAFFLYLLSDFQNWESIENGKFYGFYKKVKKVFEHKFYTDGKFDGRLNSFESDPFSSVLEDEYSKIEIESQKLWIRSQIEEYEAIAKIDSLSENELVAVLKPGNFSLNLSIAGKLLKNSANFSEELLQSLDWESEKENVFAFSKLFFQDPAFKEKLFGNRTFQDHLGYFIKHYRDISSKDLAKTLFAKFKDLQNSSVILKTAKALEPDAVLHCFFSIHWAFQKENRLPELESILDGILKKADVRKPEYVLIATNLGVIHIQNGNLNRGKELFEKLFSMDWSRFDYQKDHADDFADKILGGSLDEQYATIFKKYYALAKFNAACLYSKLEDPEQSVLHLKDAVSLEPSHYNKAKIAAEADFDPLKNNEVYQNFINSLN
ncbi:TPR end-of-group domain-containing protein [Leptospira barantonii]|uniref:Anaphase-promoting complex subunit 5 domain protein n=1 Tax=Leptospira barantonii TaxID=2023184 RepID=A0ABX4NMI8_9LEPT|nr:hypothetical protein [Leptospira barantonii]PJZ57930.1 anaphase-promoting complex subunit 5 domain protein [Leptospira barantonii]